MYCTPVLKKLNGSLCSLISMFHGNVGLLLLFSIYCGFAAGPGVKSATLTRALDVVAAEYNCNALKGTLCSSMKRFVPSGRKQFGKNGMVLCDVGCQ